MCERCDFLVTDYGTIVYFTPQTEAAREFASELGLEPWQRLGGSFAVDHRPARDVLDLIENHGLTITC